MGGKAPADHLSNNGGRMNISRALHTPFLVNRFIRQVKRQQKFLKEELSPHLDRAWTGNDGSLEESDFKKIYKYYGLAVPCILGEELAALRGRPLSKRERLALSYQGAMTGLFDDFFDKHDLPEEALMAFIQNPGSITGSNSVEKLFLFLFQKALEYSHHPERMNHYLLRVHAAQVDSLRQTRNNPGAEEISRITRDKGGVSVLFYRSSLEEIISTAEEEALYFMGGLMQFGNDIFDVYKDSRDEISTHMTTTAHVADTRTLFRQWRDEAFGKFEGLGYKQSNLRLFLRMVSLSLCARCEVCFEQLEGVEKKNGGVFEPAKHERRELVCDLDNWGNKWKSVKYHVLMGC
jgi:hypothetical protein